MHDAGCVAARCIWQIFLRLRWISTISNVRLHRINTHGVDFDKNLQKSIRIRKIYTMYYVLYGYTNEFLSLSLSLLITEILNDQDKFDLPDPSVVLEF